MLKCLIIIKYNSSITLYAVAGYDSYLWQDGSTYLEYYTEVVEVYTWIIQAEPQEKTDFFLKPVKLSGNVILLR